MIYPDIELNSSYNIYRALIDGDLMESEPEQLHYLIQETSVGDLIELLLEPLSRTTLFNL